MLLTIKTSGASFTNAHLGKILNFCKILDLKETKLKEMFDHHCIPGLIFKIKNYNIT
jgi:hypothetical protein